MRPPLDRHCFRTVALLLAFLALLLAWPTISLAQPDTVVLLHGYGRTSLSMRPLEKRLEEAGFRVYSLGYPSILQSPSELVAYLERELRSCCESSPQVHFVTHSLGGILVRSFLAEHHPDNLGRVVMLAPPNHGSELADLVRESNLLSLILGPTVRELGTDPDSLPNRLPPPWYELGIIAGYDYFNPIGRLFVPEPSDGTVSVASTQLEGMHDFVIVGKSHTFIMRSAEVGDYVIRFIRTGTFQEMSP